jgi:hypothetical protein
MPDPVTCPACHWYGDRDDCPKVTFRNNLFDEPYESRQCPKCSRPVVATVAREDK